MMKKTRMWMIIVIISVILVLLAIRFIFLYNTNNKSNGEIKNELIKQEIEEFVNVEYSGIFCSMYPISNYEATDFESYVGVKTYQSSVEAVDLEEVAQYLEVALQKETQVSHIFLGLEPSEIMASSKGKADKWNENINQYLSSYIEENPDVAFRIMLPNFSKDYWMDMKSEEVKEKLQAYERLVIDLSVYENVICYFLGNEEWLISNPSNFATKYEPHKELTRKMLLYTFCDNCYQIDESNVNEKLAELENYLEKERVNPTVYADFSNVQVVLFGDSIFGNYKGSTAITGVMSAFSGCETYNYAIGGSLATDFEGYEQSFNDVLTQFVNGTAKVTQGDNVFVRDEGKELYFLIHYGINDFFCGYQTDDRENPYNTESFGGAMRSGIKILQEQYPDAKIMVILPWCHYEAGVYEGELSDYVVVASNVAEEMQIFSQDNYTALGLTENNYSEYLSDGCHPNEKGCMNMAINILRDMEEQLGYVCDITPSKLISMEMVQNYDFSNEETVSVMLGTTLNSSEDVENESEYANFAIADVNDYVNVRNSPSTEGEIVGKIYDGAVAQVLSKAGENDEWFQITSGNVEGYIKAEFFIYGEDAALVMDEYVTKYVIVKADRLNIRKDATIDSDRMGYLDNGEKVKLVEELGQWMKVQYLENKEGYVSAEYVQIQEEYTYAKTIEEERKEIEERKAKEQREKVSENLVPENTEVIQQPNTNYATNTELRTSIVNYALQYVGDKYVSGGTSLATGTDCSGFTCFVYADFGYSISRTPEGQFSGAGRSIDYSQIQPGDIICYSSNGGKSCTHVAMYIGDGQVVHAANSRKGVITSHAEYEPIIGIKNVID